MTTLHQVMIRNYADMLWSSYNFWCHWYYDGTSCSPTRWVIPDLHTRSPEIFHDIVQGDINNTKVFSPFYKENIRPCAFGSSYFSEFLETKIWTEKNNISWNRTLVFASEVLQSNPEAVVEKVIRVMNINETLFSFNLTNFSSVRYNAQENRGMKSELPMEKYHPGLFAVSKYRPMLNSTRKLLDKCWYSDCLKISQISGYRYEACS
jgi:hypothetical protein